MTIDRKAIEKQLYNYPLIDGAIRKLDMDIEELINDISIGGGDMFGEKSSPTYKITSSVENEVIKREENQHIINLKRKRNNLIYQKKKIDNTLNCLNDIEQELIKLRYFNINRPTWVNISMQLGFDDSYCKKLRNKAIDKISMILCA